MRAANDVRGLGLLLEEHALGAESKPFYYTTGFYRAWETYEGGRPVWDTQNWQGSGWYIATKNRMSVREMARCLGAAGTLVAALEGQPWTRDTGAGGGGDPQQQKAAGPQG